MHPAKQQQHVVHCLHVSVAKGGVDEDTGDDDDTGDDALHDDALHDDVQAEASWMQKYEKHRKCEKLENDWHHHQHHDRISEEKCFFKVLLQLKFKSKVDVINKF